MGLNEADIRRILWTFGEAALAVAITAAIGWTNGQAFDVKVVIIGAVAAGLAAVKNFLLPDGSTLK
jgi:malic enzyme